MSGEKPASVVVDGIRLLDPTSTETRERVPLAPRLATLDGVRFGLLANGKHHGRLLLDMIVEELGSRWDLGEPMRLTKEHPSRPPTDDEVGMLAGHSMAILSAIGDQGSCSSCSVHDGITFERLGIPAAVVITAPFIPTAEAISELDGMPGYGYVAIPHPVTSLSATQLAERARDAATQVEALLLGEDRGAPRAEGAVALMSREDVETVLAPYRTGLQTDGADLFVEAVDDDEVALRLAFSDETCMDCVMPPPTVRGVLASLLSNHYGRDVTVLLDDPRDAVPTSNDDTTQRPADRSTQRRDSQ